MDAQLLEPMDLTTNKIVVPVKIDGVEYTLEEASGDVACKYRNRFLECTKLENGKVIGVQGTADLEPFLVSMCLWHMAEGGKKTNVPAVTIRSWPSKIQTQLFKRAKDISGIAEEEETIESLQKKLDAAKKKKEELGNSSSGSQDGSSSPATSE